MKSFYIPTSIVYTNSSPHIGFALEVIQADVVARYHRLLGEDVLFSTGTDEHGIKNARAAETLGKTPADFTEEIARKVMDLTNALNLSNNEFIRTTDKKRHWPTVKKVWLKFKDNGDIYKKQYKGIYCVGCEGFVVERDLADGKCSIHKKPPEVVEEENYFFRLSKYGNQLKKIIGEKEMKIIPEHGRNELIDFIGQGLEDVSCSRPSEKLGWGVPVPDDETQTVYVWLEALVNYLSVVDYATEGDRFKKFWPPDVHCIGKDIFTRFHGSLWPAMLLSLGVALPKRIFVHGFITAGGEKMSKSLGNVVDPFPLIEKYGADAVRYFLLREIPPTEDGDFTQEKFEERYNTDLANGLGNQVKRILTLADTYGVSPQFPDREVVIKEWGDRGLWKNLESFEFSKALDLIWRGIPNEDEEQRTQGFLNIYSISDSSVSIEVNRPFDPSTPKAIREETIVNNLIALWRFAIALESFLPETSEKIKVQLSGGKAVPLFPRILSN